MLPDPYGLTHFHQLKALLAPFEHKLYLPEGTRLADVTPVYDPDSLLPPDTQRVLSLGIIDRYLSDFIDPNEKDEDEDAPYDPTIDEIAGRLWKEKGPLWESIETDFGPLSHWGWLDEVDQDKLAVLDEYIVYLGGNGGGDAFVQVRVGKYTGAFAVLSHEEMEDELLDEVRTDGTPDEAIESCYFLYLNNGKELFNLETAYIRCLENLAKLKAQHPNG